MRNFLLLMLLIFTGAFASAQDKIYMTSGKIIDCKVTEVGTEEIKYKISPEADAAVFTVKKIDVIKIEFANGHVERFVDELDDPNLYKDNRKNAWKVDFLSPIYGSTIFSYERSMRPGFSLEGSLGLIGLGRTQNLFGTNPRPAGAFIKVGPRFMKTPNFRSGSLRYYHVLKGAYIQPQAIFGTFNSNVQYTNFDPNTNNATSVSGRENTTYGALMITVGSQSVYSNIFLVDFYVGFGWGFNNTTTQHKPSNYIQEFSLPNTRTYGAWIPNGSYSIPWAGTAGIKIGILTK
ncbi:MAG: hypothetical protein GC180_04365 [Bacteroidetes bacterium]|nr:hypothetical protein [Bacteroidota bacterium]